MSALPKSLLRPIAAAIALASFALSWQCGLDDPIGSGIDAGSSSSSGGPEDAGAASEASLDAGADAADASPDLPFLLGADITYTQEDEANGATFSDNGTPMPILSLLKAHGFNYVRLRTFVDPTQPTPNPQGGTFPPYSPAGFGDMAHTVTFGHEIKAAGMGFLLDFHYSDTWADPGKQIKPSAWVNDDLPAAVAHVHDYTLASLQSLTAARARPDMVQIGNEITPGMLLTPGTPLGPSSTAGWPQLAQLLNAGIHAVHEVDPTIKIMLHLDRGADLPSSMFFLQSAMANGVAFDVFGESCYVAYQGPPSTCAKTFSALVTQFPGLKFVMAEYNADPADPTDTELRQANDAVFDLLHGQGLGAFFWEPTRNIGSANRGMFTLSGSVYSPIPDCINQYDQMKTAYGL